MEKVKFKKREFDTEHEAICSALFDKYRWEWERPQKTYGGWYPDFILKGKTVVLVECKGALEFDKVKEFQELPRYEDAVSGTDHEVLLIPKSPKSVTKSNGYDISALGYLYDRERWSYAELGRWSDKVGFCHTAGSWEDRMSGEDVNLSSGNGKRPNVEQDWNFANQVFRGDQESGGKRVSYFQESSDSKIEYWDMSGEQREPW